MRKNMVGGVLLAYFILNLAFSDGGSITWFDPPPVETTADNNVIRTYSTSLLDGSTNVELNWNFSLTQDSTFGSLKLELDSKLVATVIQSGQSDISASFRGRVNVRWIPQKVSLTILKVSTQDNGEFSCVVSTIGGGSKQWTRKIKVTVLVPASITNVSQDQTVREGSDLQLFCEASGSPAPNINWLMVFRNGSKSEVLHRGPTWNMVNITRTNQGAYRCVAYNGVGIAVSSVVNINVTYPAKIIKRQNSTVQVGGYAALICQSEGNPTSVITWTRDKTNEVVGYGSTLVVCSVQFYHGGWYTCSSANSLGKDRASVYLEVTEKRITLINVTMTISNEEYHEDIERLGSEKSQSLVARIKEAVKAVFQCDSSFENTDVVGFRPGSVIVSFFLTFKEHVTEEHAISTLKAAVKSGNLGAFKVNGSSIVATEEYDFKNTPTRTRSTPVQACNGCSCNCIIFIAVLVILVAVIIFLLIYVVWLHRRGHIKRRPTKRLELKWRNSNQI